MNTYALRCLVALMALLPLRLPAQNCYSTFSVSRTEGCAPLSLFVRSHVSNENPIYYYGDGTVGSQPTHTYAAAGTYRLVRIITPSCAATVSDTITIRVYDNTPPELRIDACLRYARLTIPDSRYPWYQVLRADSGEPLGLLPPGGQLDLPESAAPYEIAVRGTLDDQTSWCGEARATVEPWQAVPAAQPRGIFWGDDGRLGTVFARQNTDLVHLWWEQSAGGEEVPAGTAADTLFFSEKNPAQIHCFRVATLTDCQDAAGISSPGQLPEEQFGPKICTHPFSAQALPGFNEVAWEAYALGAEAVEALYVLRDADTAAVIAGGEAGRWQDADVVCGQEYCYSVALRLRDGATVAMPAQCVVAENSGNPVGASLLRAGFEGDSMVVRWELGAGRIVGLSLLRLEGGTAGAPLALPDTAQAYIETGFRTESDTALCFQLAIADSCGNVFVSEPTCPIGLQASKDGEHTVLEWSAFSGLDGRFGYVLERREEAGPWEEIARLDAREDGYRVLRRDIGARRNAYRLAAVLDADEAVRAYSNEVRVVEPVHLVVPDAFTPNEDGRNERFTFWGVNVAGASVRIYSRLGQEVFSGTMDGPGWDGTFQEQPLPQGGYVYVMEASDAFGGTFVKKGTLLLLRP